MQVIKILILFTFFVGAQEESRSNDQYILYDAFIEKHNHLKETKCPTSFSCSLFLSDRTNDFNGKIYNEFRLPEEGELQEKRIKTYYRIEKNKLFYFSDFYNKADLSEVVLFSINRDTSTIWTIKNFYSDGLANFRIKQVDFQYSQELKDTVHTYKVLDYSYGVTVSPIPLYKLTFTKTNFLQTLEYKFEKTRIVLKRKNSK